MNMKKITWILVFVLVVAGIVWLIRTPGKPGRLDAFASCVAESDATFYGAFWCPHCQNQKAMFGSSARLLPYTECSTPDGNGQLSVCTDAGIQTYPTWEFADGSRQTGVLSLDALSTITGCQLPGESQPTGSAETGGQSEVPLPEAEISVEGNV